MNNIILSSLKTTAKKKPLNMFLLFAAIILGISMQLVPPQLLKNIIDNNISLGVSNILWKLSSYYMLAVIISGIADFVREFMMAIIGENMLSNIRYNMGEKLAKLPISYFSNNPIGEVMSRFTSDVDAVGTLFTTGLIGMLADTLKALGIIVSIYLLSPTLALYSLVLIPMIYFIAKYFKDATLKAQMKTRKAVGHINAFIQELFNDIRTVKIFGMERHFISNFQKPLNDNIDAVHKTSTFDSIFPCLMQVFRSFIITITVIIAAPSGLGTLGITSGSLAAIIDLISRILAPVESIAMEFQTIQEAVSGVKRIEDFLNEANENRYTDAYDELSMDLSLKDKYTHLSISLKEVSFCYNEGKNVVENISLDIKAGTKVALVGRTGAGKSTILNLVAGLYTPNKGSIKIGGFNPFTMSPNLRRHIIGIVPQSFPIYNGSVKDAITLFDESITLEEVITAAKNVGLHKDIIKLPQGYDTLIGEGESKLSYGQYQLLSLACALVCNPPILLLDEVTSGLDAITEQKIFKVLREVSKDRTILTISHRVSGIIDADEVVILENGVIVERGTPEELVGKEGWYAKYNEIEKLGWRI